MAWVKPSSMFNTKQTYPNQSLDNDLCQAVRAGNTVYVRGQVGTDFDGKLVGLFNPGVVTQFLNSTYLNQCYGICVGSDNNLWITQQGNRSVVRFTTGGLVLAAMKYINPIVAAVMHVAGSLLSVLESLWKARTKLAGAKKC